jgi:predicted nucleic acid-binding protein
MKAVIDANIALAQFLELPYADKAREQLDGVTEILAPALIFSESSNAHWRLVKAGHLKPGYADNILDATASLVSEICDDSMFMNDALRHAVALDHPVTIYSTCRWQYV